MTVTCREACCSATPRLTVSELFERGFRRRRKAPLAIEGPACADAAGNIAAFSLDVVDGRIKAANFRTSSCATLIAYCELIAETVPGSGHEIAKALTAPQIVEALPGVPPLKHERAALAIAAFHAALDLVATQQGVLHEGRLHLRHPAP